MVMILLAAVACERRQPPIDPQPTASTDNPSLWVKSNRSTVVSVTDHDDDAELAAATSEARATAEEAREKWLLADEGQRLRWFIKWAARTAEGRVEHVWVRPVNWSPFRIEGVLASEPIGELAAGKRAGDLVSFAVEELSDWMYLHSEDSNGPRDGGFTVEVLEERFGKPSE